MSDSCDSMDNSVPGSSVQEISQERMLVWVAIPFSTGSSRPRDWTSQSLASPAGAGGFFTTELAGKPLCKYIQKKKTYKIWGPIFSQCGFPNYFIMRSNLYFFPVHDFHWNKISKILSLILKCQIIHINWIPTVGKDSSAQGTVEIQRLKKTL